MERGTPAAFARMVGISQARAAVLRRDGSVTGETVEELTRSYCAFLRGHSTRAASHDAGLVLARERAELARAQRRRIEREERTATGAFVSAEAVTATWTRLAGNVKARLLAIPSKVGTRLSVHGDIAAEAAAAVETEVFEALDELSATDGVPR